MEDTRKRQEISIEHVCEMHMDSELFLYFSPYRDQIYETLIKFNSR
jgi:hypothetical protein